MKSNAEYPLQPTEFQHEGLDHNRDLSMSLSSSPSTSHLHPISHSIPPSRIASHLSQQSSSNVPSSHLDVQVGPNNKKPRIPWDRNPRGDKNGLKAILLRVVYENNFHIDGLLKDNFKKVQDILSHSPSPFDKFMGVEAYGAQRKFNSILKEVAITCSNLTNSSTSRPLYYPFEELALKIMSDMNNRSKKKKSLNSSQSASHHSLVRFPSHPPDSIEENQYPYYGYHSHPLNNPHDEANVNNPDGGSGNGSRNNAGNVLLSPDSAQGGSNNLSDVVNGNNELLPRETIENLAAIEGVLGKKRKTEMLPLRSILKRAATVTNSMETVPNSQHHHLSTNVSPIPSSATLSERFFQLLFPSNIVSRQDFLVLDLLSERLSRAYSMITIADLFTVLKLDSPLHLNETSNDPSLQPPSFQNPPRDENVIDEEEAMKLRNSSSQEERGREQQRESEVISRQESSLFFNHTKLLPEHPLRFLLTLWAESYGGTSRLDINTMIRFTGLSQSSIDRIDQLLRKVSGLDPIS